MHLKRFLFALLVLPGVLQIVSCGSPSEEIERTRVSVSQAMGGEPDSGFERVTGPQEFVFPRDHGPHYNYATEWWYITGNLTDSHGRRFGYQITFFRIGLEPPVPDEKPPNPWRTRQLYMAHLALTDVQSGRHHSRERFARGSLGLAGAEASPFKVWLRYWKIQARESTLFPFELSARDDDFSLDLVINEGSKGIIKQGDNGYSKKGYEVGNASYYYSMTRLPTQGEVRINGQSYTVSGNSWLDREWSSSALENDQEGWDWFSLQLNDGRDLMIYQLRQKGGHQHPLSAGVLVDGQGAVTHLKVSDFELIPQRTWESPSGVAYPVDWRLKVPELGIDLDVRTVLDDQLMDHTVRYWEGAVDVSGTQTGQGYLEMSGYSTGSD